MKTTVNYALKKPEENDFYSVNDQNDNMDIIDTQMKKSNKAITALSQAVDDVKKMSVMEKVL